ncbi:chitin-binding lectin 1-like isoform X2 [Hyposmocoma kahamanoa]|uniref:chitin-binding lectin 1-like isoform X2 n=1 Tax=Hyposmocoma kahamanoa TaxID=1477025 RepID=UPI000E6D69A5|nr:chitin-binding lectin 1-like isoform X2 [Hyposmocoma kahamanoa]
MNFIKANQKSYKMLRYSKLVLVFGALLTLALVAENEVSAAPAPFESKPCPPAPCAPPPPPPPPPSCPPEPCDDEKNKTKNKKGKDC